MNYIKLPNLKRVKVENYPLFKDNLEYKIIPGLNLFIGANGLGKTTTTSLIIYGIVGFTAEGENRKIFKIDKEYFQSRSFESFRDSEKKPFVEIEFVTGEEQDFRIRRELYRDHIISFHLNGQLIPNDKYAEELLKHSSVGSMEDFSLLLEFFLVREEEGNYLLWDFEKQSEIIQILITNVGFRRKYAKEFELFREMAGEYNHFVNDNIIKPKKAVQALLAKKKELLAKKGEIRSLKELEKDKSGLENQRENLNRQKEEAKVNLQYVLNNLKDSENKKEMLLLEVDQISNQILTLETKLFSGIYSDERILNIVHKLKHYNTCIFCKNTIPKNKASSIYRKIEVYNRCPICDSGLTEDTSSQNINVDKLASEIDAKDEQLGEIKRQLAESQKTSKSLKDEHILLTSTLRRINTQLTEVELEIYELETKIASSTNPKDFLTSYDLEKKFIDEGIEKSQKKAIALNIKLKKQKKKTSKLNDELTKSINSFLENLNKIFEEYAKTYFKQSTKLVIKRKESIGTRQLKEIKKAYYIPEFDGIPREKEKQCSTSERIFLEYLFRLSLLKLYEQESGNTPFMIMETSEGAFDLTSTRELSNMFTEFSSEEIPLILITNFSKPDFLRSLGKGLSSKKAILDYLSIGKIQPEDKKNKDLDTYHSILKEVKDEIASR